MTCSEERSAAAMTRAASCNTSGFVDRSATGTRQNASASAGHNPPTYLSQRGIRRISFRGNAIDSGDRYCAAQ